MEEEWMRDRALLRDLLNRHPTWRLQDYALAVGRSRSWVKKWCRRLREADPYELDNQASSPEQADRITILSAQLDVLMR